MTTTEIRFGTDGWRGVMGVDFTPENVARVADAFAEYVHGRNPARRPVAIGFDGRKDSRAFAQLFANVLTSRGITVLFSSGIVPTPVLAFTTKVLGCVAGVMVTASHNPPQYNGLKFKSSYGGPFLTADTKIVESLVRKERTTAFGSDSTTSSLISVVDFLPPYLSHLKTIVDFEALRQFAKNPENTASVLIDSMGGAGQTILEDILVGCGWRAQTLFGEPEPTFFDRSPEPISKNLEPLEYNVGVTDTQFGIATDGDADRCGIVYADGEWMSAQDTILSLLWHLHDHKGWRGAVVKTASVTEKVTRLAKEWHEPVFDVAVGFKYVTEVMLREVCMFGAEESGGFGYGKHLPDRDGILSGLLFAEILATSGKTLRQFVDGIREKLGTVYYDRIDQRTEKPAGPDLLAGLIEASHIDIAGVAISGITKYEEMGLLTGVKLHFGDERWLLIRISQTEPMIRLYSEASSPEEVRELLSLGKNLLNI